MQASSRRLIFRLYVASQPSSEMSGYVLVAALRKEPLLSHALVGSERLLNDRSARILEVTEVAAAKAFARLLGEAVVISGTEMLIHTTAAQAD